MLAANVFDRAAYLMDNTELDTCIGEYALYSIREAPLRPSMQHISISQIPVLKIAQNLQPEVCTFTLGDIHTKKSLVAFPVDT